MIFDIINDIILFILALSTLIGILDFVGFLPSKLRWYLRMNRVDDTIKLLEDLGIDVDKQKRINQSFNFPKDFHKETIEQVTYENLEQVKIEKELAIGHGRVTKVDYYYDLIGASCNHSVAENFARLMSTFWSTNILNRSIIGKPDFDFIVTPKGGSPILGYEFSKLVKKPFLLHEYSERFSNNQESFRSKFDCNTIPEKGSTALIVDDSTTGGMMVLNAVNDLEKMGYNVYTCFVVFEPQHKDARKKLDQKNIQLVSIIKTHDNLNVNVK